MQQLHGNGEKVIDSQQPLETVIDMLQLSEIGETVRDNQQPWETETHILQLRERQPANI